ncbi:MAG: membrane protein insertase YidC [Erysipelotrichaceae bacterium]
MKKILKNKKLMITILVIFGLFALGGCASITGPDGKVLPEKLIALSTPFNAVFSNEGWFEAFLVYPVAQLINFLANYIGPVGGLISATVLINLLTIALSIKSTVGTQKMQMVQPQMQKIQAKYADRKDQESQMKMAKELQDLYAKEGINPFGSILVTFIQLPIIMVLWQSSQRAISIVQGSFLGFSLETTPLEGFKTGQWFYVIVFVIMLLVQFASMKIPTYLAKRKNKDVKKSHSVANAPDPNKSMGMMSNFMIIFIGFISINWPIAMSIYWIVSSITMILKTVFIQWKFIDNAK